MKRLFFSVAFLLAITSGLMAQQGSYEISEAINFFNSHAYSRGDYTSVLEDSDIEGSPYLNDDFMEGSVFTKSKTQFVGIPLRYNVYNDEMEFKSDKGVVQAIAAPETIEKIEFGEYKMVYLPYIINRKIQNGYFVEMEKGEKAALYARPKVNFQKATKPAAYQDAEPPRFSRQSDDYYIRVGQEAAALISRKKDLREVFPDHAKKVKSFIKENNVRPNKPERLKALVRFYNSL